jgi:hypothetical protein
MDGTGSELGYIQGQNLALKTTSQEVSGQSLTSYSVNLLKSVQRV